MNKHPIQFFKDYKITPRVQQTNVLEQVFKEWDNYKYIALNLPTGVGKTFIATAIADSVKKAYILTSTLQLQDQYMESWNALVNLKGRSNYTCGINSAFTVDAAPCTSNPDLYNQCRQDNICPYIIQKNKALASKAMITNPVYMLYSTHCGFAKDEDSPWVKRDVLIIDEAHNTEDSLVKFSESAVDPKKYHDDFGVDTSKIIFTGDVNSDYVLVSSIQKILEEKATELQLKLEEEFPKAKLFGMELKEWAKGFNDKTSEKVKKLNAKIYQLDKAIQPLKIFFNSHFTQEEFVSRWIFHKHEKENILTITPIYGDFLFKEYFGTLADKFVFLSATLGSKSAFCKELGIKESECLYIETDSPFDSKKSPIIVLPSIKLSKNVYEENVKLVGSLIDGILDMHPSPTRGIIHSTTYDIAKHIYNDVSKENRKRLLSRDMDVLSNNDQYPKRYKNSELLEIHELSGSSYGSVLLSPSMMEGVDLHDDLSEFQVIIKLPWLNLGDIRTRKKSDMDSLWYNNRMWLSILQASGRSTRHEEDCSTTYILDKNFKYFYSEWQNQLPGWFKKRLVF